MTSALQLLILWPLATQC